jgi:rod shape determining protein RodA
MSRLFENEGAQVSAWWEKFANFSWRTDWTQVVIILFLSSLGVIAINSAGSYRQTNFGSSQMIYLGIGWVAYWMISSLDYRTLRIHARRIYLIGIILLLPISLCALAKINIGSFIRSINGARRWMDFGPFSIQPSEFAKVSALIFIAALLVLKPIGSWRKSWPTVIKVLAAAGLPFVLIFIQPDLGSALIYLPLSFALLFVAGLRSRFFLAAGLSAVLLGAVVAADLYSYASKITEYAKTHDEDFNPAKTLRGQHEQTAWFFLLKDYQRERLLSFVAPSIIDPHWTRGHLECQTSRYCCRTWWTRRSRYW